MNPDPDSPERKTLSEQWIVGAGLMIFWAVLILAIFWGCSPCPAAEIRTLEWQANPEAVSGYRLYKLPERMLLATTPGTVASVPLEIGEIVALAAYNDTGESSLTAPVTITASVTTLDRAGWTVHSYSSEEANREHGTARNAYDGQPSTLWHTDWDALPPHYLAIALPRAATVSRLDYLPRQDGNANGRILAYEIQSSDDGLDWQPWGAGTWADDATGKTAPLPLRSIRFFRLWGNERFAAAAEITLRGSYDPAMVRVTLQRGNLTAWQDVRTDEFPKTTTEFFRLKIETP